MIKRRQISLILNQITGYGHLTRSSRKPLAMEIKRAVRSEGQQAVRKADLPFAQISAFAAAAAAAAATINAGAFDNTTVKHTDGRDFTLDNTHHAEQEENEPVAQTSIRVKKRPALAEGYVSDDATQILKEIQFYIEMAEAAYKNKLSMSDCKKSVARSHLLMRPRTDTEVHVCILNNNSVVFAFRGTECADFQSFIKDIFTNIYAKQEVVQLYNGPGRPAYTSLPDIQAHSGFQDAFRDATDGTDHNLMSVLQDELGMDAGDVGRVVCVGHSLGGALATLCAKWCREVAFPGAEIWCVTMGSLCVGNAAFAADFDRSGIISYRVVNKTDVVPYVLNWIAYLLSMCGICCSPYEHVSRPIYLWEEEKSGEMRSSLGGSPPISLCSLFFGNPYRDHAAKSYVASVQSIIKHKSTFNITKN